MRLFFVMTALGAAVLALPTDTELPEPAKLALLLNEDDFEDYLDKWLEVEELKWINDTSIKAEPRSGCSFQVRGGVGQPTPVFLHRNTHLTPNGNSGRITLNNGEEVVVACTGSGRTIRHPRATNNRAVTTVRCASNDHVSSPGWLNGNGAFRDLTCSDHALHVAERTSERCHGNNIVIRVGFIVNNVFHTKYRSCFNQNRLEVLYVWYSQNPYNALHKSGVTRPSFLPGGFFPGVNINNLYTQATQRATIARLVGQQMADSYITTTQFLARGHLAAMTDFVFATGQRASFYFINAAPQFQPFNAGNWNTLEQFQGVSAGKHWVNEATKLFLRGSNAFMTQLEQDNSSRFGWLPVST